MRHARLCDMLNGWFVGNFDPAVLKTNACEVAVKHFKAGDREIAHYHKIATEVTLILVGKVRMAGEVWAAGDIVVLGPEECSDFEALTDVTTVVVKTPGVPGDKYLVHPIC